MLAVIEENKLDSWVAGNAREAEEVIVELVWRLVAASCPKPLDRRFPLGDSIGQHGPDGILHVNLGYAPFVPEGHTYWEIGTGRKAQDKATSDYTSLTSKVLTKIRKESIFVFVTPRSGRTAWKEKAQAAWLEERRNRKEWKDVRVIDGTKLIDWIRQFPAIGIWLAGKIHGPQMEQIEIPERHWEVLRSYGAPPLLTPDVFLVNRDTAFQKLQELFDGKSKKLKLITRFPSQVVDFVCAYLASLDREPLVDIASRSLIISDIKAWNTVCDQYQGGNFILIADPALDLSGDTGSREIQRASESGHSVIYDAPYGGPPDDSSVLLQSPRAHQIKEALVAAGHPGPRAHILSDRCDKNLGVLLRLLQGHSLPPKWAANSGSADLAFALLVGSWKHGSEADRAVIRELTGIEYKDWIRTIREVAGIRNPPVIDQEGNWKFISRFEGWYVLANVIDEDHLDKLREVAVWVLRWNGPQFEPSPEELLQAAIQGNGYTLSPLLRKGLAESLALIGSQLVALPSYRRAEAKYSVDRAICDILSDADWELWGSLDSLLPLFAEASPDEFLRAVHNALEQTSCPFDQLFSLEVAGIFGRNYLTGLLWALETLAWDKRFLEGACLLLGRLASRDPGGEWANRPIGSLTRILLPWLRQTTVSAQERVDVVRILRRKVPSAAWHLLLGLLPDLTGFALSTHRPSWRNTIPDDWNAIVPQQEVWAQIDSYADILVEMACEDLEKLKGKEFIGQLHKLPHPVLARILDHLKSETVTSQLEDQRIGLWTELARYVRHQKEVSNASWSLSEEDVSKIERIVEKISPTNPSTIRRLLFSSDYFLLFEQTEDRKVLDQKCKDRRQQTIGELLLSCGIDTVIELAQVVEFPKLVGNALAAYAEGETDERLLPEMLESDNEKLTLFAQGYVWSRRYCIGWEWVDALDRSSWTAAQIGRFLSWLPFTAEAWERAGAWLGESETEYWTIADVKFLYDVDGETGLAIDKLIKYGRPQAAIKCLGVILYKKNSINHDQAFRALLSVETPIDLSDRESQYTTIEIIKALQTDPDASPDGLLEVEWRHFDLLRHHHGASPKTIESKLASDPAYFSKVIQIRYRSETEATHASQLNEQERVISENAFSMLNYEWQTPPGVKPDGKFQADEFVQWLTQVRDLCHASGLLDKAFIHIGRVLFNCPRVTDGLWIHPTVAGALNDFDAKAMRRGYCTAITNSRGFHVVDGTGNEERNLAKENRQKADEVKKAGYPRLAETFREVAERYDSKADDAITRDAQQE